MKTMLQILTILVLVGCVSPKLPTASGRPEITTKATKAQVREVIANHMVSTHGLLQQESESILVYDVPASSAANFWFANTLTGQKPVYRLRLNLVQEADTVRVIGWQTMVHQPGLGGTSEADLDSKKQLDGLQTWLDRVRADLGK